MTHKLLLADDSVTIQRVIELTFAGQDVDIVAVGDGEQAIARIPAERPDIVIADIGMPKRSGYEVAAFVKGHPELRHIPVLLLAGAFEPVDDAKAEQAGCDGVLVKPFEPQHVIARVRELLEGVKGSPTQAAAADVARPVERLTARDGRPVIAPPAHLGAPPAPRAPDPLPEPITDASLDDYFDRLDAAFATMGSSAPPPAADPEPDLNIPTLEDLLATPVEDAPPAEPSGSGWPPSEPQTVAPAPQPPPAAPVPPRPVASGFGRDERDEEVAPADGRNVIADVFTMMFAAEQGEPGATPPRLPLGPQEPVITEAMIDEVTRRVLERLAPDAARAVVVDVVSEVAERLVRQEIARIRGTQ